MQGFNKVIIVGRLGREPELRQTPQGKVLCRLAVATNRSWRQGEEWQEETDWHDVVLWEDLAERAARNLGRGDICAIEGRLSARSWEDAQGQKHRSVEVIASRCQAIGGKRPRPQESAERDPASQARADAAMPDEATPF